MIGRTFSARQKSGLQDDYVCNEEDQWGVPTHRKKNSGGRALAGSFFISYKKTGSPTGGGPQEEVREREEEKRK